VKPNTGNTWDKQSPYDRFNDFIAPNADRKGILLKQIEALKLNSAAINVAGNDHIFIFPPGQRSLRGSGGAFPFKGEAPYLLCAHYDRVAGSPGANDNSIAVFHLLKAAIILSQRGIHSASSGSAYRWIVVFTDKEEIGAGEHFEDQGSYSLAEKLKSWGLEKARVFNFDVCGCGGVLLFSTTTDLLLQDINKPNIQKVRGDISLVRNHALETANLLRLDRAILAPTPFSDDAGFLRAGMAAQTITTLPENEATQYEAFLRSRSDFARLLVSGQFTEKHRLPETWRSLNSNMDTPSRLTPEFFEQMVRFIVGICR
jgi:hypothetical protein